MGMIDNSFAVFCEGLGSNSALKALDLRNNQISHDGAAELAAGLKRNTALKSLGNIILPMFQQCTVHVCVSTVGKFSHLLAKA